VSELVRDKINEDDSLCIVSDDKTIRHSGSVSFMSTSVTSERTVMSCRLSVHLTALHCAVLYCAVLYCSLCVVLTFVMSQNLRVLSSLRGKKGRNPL
jgi:late competence protein required for DNA uptake (superfamily II DNA/RNA helicase)